MFSVVRSVVLCAASLMCVAALRAERLPEKPSGSIRFLCLAPDLPPRYEMQSNGALQALGQLPESLPPPMVYLKQGRGYTPCEYTSSGLSQPNVLKNTGDSAECVYFKVPKSPKTSARQGAGNDEPDWVPLVNLPKNDGTHYLACLYHPSLQGKWYPPKSLFLNIGPEVYPAHGSLVLNLSGYPAYVQVGAGNKPAMLKADGGFAYTPPSPAGTEVCLKILVVDGQTKTVACNRTVQFAEGERLMVVIVPTFAVSAKRKVEVRQFMVPTATPNAPRTLAGTR